MNGISWTKVGWALVASLAMVFLLGLIMNLVGWEFSLSTSYMPAIGFMSIAYWKKDLLESSRKAYAFGAMMTAVFYVLIASVFAIVLVPTNPVAMATNLVFSIIEHAGISGIVSYFFYPSLSKQIKEMPASKAKTPRTIDIE